MMKTTLEDDVAKSIGAVYAKNDIELSLPIEWGTINDENDTGRRCDCISAIYVENKSDLSSPIGEGSLFDENKKW